MEERFEQAAAGGVGGGEAGLQPVAQRHQGIDLRHDAVLFGEGWDGDRELFNQPDVERRLGKRPRCFSKIRLDLLAAEGNEQVSR